MRTIIIDVKKRGALIELALKPGSSSGQTVLVLGDTVEIKPKTERDARPMFEEYRPRANGFPPRSLKESVTVHILREHGGSVEIRNPLTGWSIYDEVAARLNVPIEVRRRPTAKTGEPAWRPEVGYCRKNLEQARIIAPTDVSGRGVCQLMDKAKQIA
jgi:hypothetical protein